MSLAFAPIYLIGPSNVGKSTAADALESAGLVRHLDLDRLLPPQAGEEHIHAVQDLTRVVATLEAIERTRSALRTLVSIGAGTQDRDRAFGDRELESWLVERSLRVVLVRGERDELYERSVAHRGNRSRFELLELGDARRRIYETAPHTVDFSRATKTLCAERLWTLVQNVDL